MPDDLIPLRPADPVDPAAVLAAMGLRDDLPADRPRAVAVMIGSLDGRATLDGRSGGLGSPADQALMQAARTAADALLVGARTIQLERYANLLGDEARARRVAAGLPERVRLVTVTRDLHGLPIGDAPIFAEEGQPITVFTESSEADAPTPDVAADLEVVRVAAWGLEPPPMVRWLRAERGVEVLVSEGGPTMLRLQLASGVLDDVMLTLAPFLVGVDPGPGLLGDAPLETPATVHLRDVHRNCSLHYGLRP
jgi:riboflavin biosynthesis pyrimidine reductase